jgi:hypothetical protein
MQVYRKVVRMGNVKVVVSFLMALCIASRSSTFSAERVSDSIVIDTFSSCRDAGTNLPCGWRASRRDVTMYSLRNEEGNWYVKVRTGGGCTSIGKKISFQPKTETVFRWRWRVETLPEGGDERVKEKEDSGAGVYVVFKGYTILKYVWSTSVPRGTTIVDPYSSRVKIIVKETGIGSLHQWVRESARLADDYRLAFSSPMPEIVGIGLLSDADNTRSSAEADYDDFYLSDRE